ncbi:uncharacterized protein RHO17_020102 [Thomomys bottae]
MKARGLGLGGSRRGVLWPWARRWGAGTFRGAGRRARSSVREMRGVRADGQRPRRRRAAESAGAGRAAGAAGPAGPIEAARDPRAVWVNGAVGEPAVVGPAGSAWVTRSEEEVAGGIWSLLDCERKGRPSPLGHESILELWLKVQAMRVASGCWEGSRVELHPVPAGERAVERGIPGRASWLETSQDGVTGPWVRGQTRAGSEISGLTTAVGLGTGCELTSGSCGPAQAGLASSPAVVPGVSEEVGCVGVPGPQEPGQTLEVLGGMALPEAVGVLRAGEVEMGCGDTPGLEDRGLVVQVPGAVTRLAGCGDTPSLWERRQLVEVPGVWVVPRAVTEETVPMGPSGIWQRRQVEEDVGSESTPGLWGAGQPTAMPCATEEEAPCGCDPGFRERAERSMWVERSSEGNAGSCGLAHPVCGPQEWTQGLWGREHAVGVAGTAGRETDCVSVSGLRGTGQLRELSRAVVLGEREKGTSYTVLPGLQEKQQSLGAPVAETEPELTKEETHSGRILNLWGRRQIDEQEAVGSATFQVPGLVNQDAVCGAASCLCGRRQAVGISETLGMPRAAGVPKHRGTPTGIPIALSVPARVPAALWVSSPACQGSHSEDSVNPWSRAPAAEVPVAPEELWSVGKVADCGAFSCSLGRRQTFGVPVAPEELGSLEAETGSEGFSGLSERRQTAGIPVAAGLSPGGGGPVALRVPRPVLEETRSESMSGLGMEREAEWGPAFAKASTSVGMPASARMSGSTQDKTLCGRVSDLSRIRQTAGASVAVGHLDPAREEETFSEGVLGLSGGRQSVEMPAATRVFMTQEVSTASGVPGLLMVGDCSYEDSMGLGRRTTETPTVARLPGLNEGAEGTEGAPGLWRSRSNRIVPGAVQGPLPLEMLTVVGAPMEKHVPAALWVTASPGEEDECASGLSVSRRVSTEGTRTSEGERGGRRAVGLAGEGQAVEASYTWGHGGLWGYPRTMGGACESVPGVAGSVSQAEMGLGHSRNYPPQSERRQGGRESGVKVRGNDVREDRLRWTYH